MIRGAPDVPATSRLTLTVERGVNVAVPVPVPLVRTAPVALLTCLSSMTPSAVLQLEPETLLVPACVMVPSTSMVIGVLELGLPQNAG